MKRLFLLISVVGAAVLAAAVLAAPAGAAPATQGDVEHGKYLATIAGCGGCHTPLGANGAPDETRAFGGGQEFDLGPLGKVVSSNLSSDKDTGLGNWTDAEIKLVIRSGKRPDGSQLFPVMPYTTYNGMAEADLDSIVAFIRTLPAINNKVEFKQVLPTEALPQLPLRTGLVAPDPSNTADRGRYLLTAVIACTDCHTPLDPQTGAPIIPDKYFAGGQPYEGPWGIVYSANITPDEETGLGKWTDAQVKRVFREGVRIDGRKVVLMPWQEFSVLTDPDLDAVVNFLRHDLKPVSNTVPAPKLNTGFAEYVDQPQQPASAAPQIIFIVGGVVVVILGVGLMIWFDRRNKAKPVK